MAHLRIESPKKVATDVKVIYVDGKKETDISHCVRQVDVRMAVGEAVIADLECYVGVAQIDQAGMGHITVIQVNPITTAFARLLDVTTFGALKRVYQWTGLPW